MSTEIKQYLENNENNTENNENNENNSENKESLDYWNISINLIAKYLQEIIRLRSNNSTKQISIVSVGCGQGTLESYLHQEYKISEFILVDPKSDSNPSECLEGIKSLIQNNLNIDYESVQDLLEKNKNLVNNCIVLLPWNLPNKSVYDIEAIQLLHPTDVVVIYESIGAACGFTFHYWLSKLGGNARYQRMIPDEEVQLSYIDEFMLNNYEFYRHHIHGKRKYNPMFGNDPNNYCLAWIKQCDLPGTASIQNTSQGKDFEDAQIHCTIQ